jgi:hypothetical protein
MRMWVVVVCTVAMLLAPCVDGASNGPHQLWSALLSQYVADGRVDYARWAEAGREPLRAYLQALASTNALPESRQAQLAFWINAYNAFTVELILRHYPLESIRDIENPWQDRVWQAGGTMWTLNEIEHEILLGRLNDPRIHFAIVRASVSGPELWNRAYTANGIEEQLDAAARRFLGSAKHVRYTATRPAWGEPKRILSLSKIFKWFGGDFGQDAAAMASYVARYADPETAHFVREAGPDITIKYLGYDWGLNQ